MGVRVSRPGFYCLIAVSCSRGKGRSPDPCFTQPVFVFAGDRFLIRDSSGRQTVAGGVVLNPKAEGTRFRGPAERSFLQARAAGPNDSMITVLARNCNATSLCTVARASPSIKLRRRRYNERRQPPCGREESVHQRGDRCRCWLVGTLRQRAIDAIDTNTLRIPSARASIPPNCAPTSRSKEAAIWRMR